MIVMVTNSIQPYCYDIAHVLGLPINFRHRFRYRDRWIKLSETIESLKCRPALLVLRDHDTGRLIPVRFVVIDNVIRVGDINYIDFRVQEYPPVETLDDVSNEIEKWLGSNKHENSPGKALSCLLFNAETIEVEGAGGNSKVESYSEWSALLERLGKLECYKDFGFLRIVQVIDAKRRVATATCDATGEYSYKLRPDRLYFLEAIQHIPWNIDATETISKPYDVELKAETNEIEVLRRIQRVVGKYDLLRFIFKTPGGYKSRNSFLELESKQDEFSTKFRLPGLFVPVRIEAPWLIRAIRWIRRGLEGLAILSVIGSNPLSVWLGADAEWVRAMALIVLVAAAGKWEQFAMEFVKEGKQVRIS